MCPTRRRIPVRGKPNGLRPRNFGGNRPDSRGWHRLRQGYYKILKKLIRYLLNYQPIIRY